MRLLNLESFPTYRHQFDHQKACDIKHGVAPDPCLAMHKVHEAKATCLFRLERCSRSWNMDSPRGVLLFRRAQGSTRCSGNKSANIDRLAQGWSCTGLAKEHRLDHVFGSVPERNTVPSPGKIAAMLASNPELKEGVHGYSLRRTRVPHNRIGVQIFSMLPETGRSRRTKRKLLACQFHEQSRVAATQVQRIEAGGALSHPFQMQNRIPAYFQANTPASVKFGRGGKLIEQGFTEKRGSTPFFGKMRFDPFFLFGVA